MLRSTLGQLIINNALPEDTRDYNRVLDKRGVAELGQQLAERHPDKYRDIMSRISNIGRTAAYYTGGNSFGLRAIKPAVSSRITIDALRRDLRGVMEQSFANDEDRNAEILKTTGKYQKTLVDDVYNESRDEDNPLAQQLMGAGRGNKFSLNSLRGADLLYVDHRGDAIPVPVLRSYSQGLTPAEYFAGAFGARKGVLDLKGATAQSGHFAKQLQQAVHRLLVTEHDDQEPYDPASPRGLPVETDDADNAGALLAYPTGGYDRNTQLTPKILKHLKSLGIANILVRSPMVGGPADGGVYAQDAGYRERGRVAPRGDYVGIAAANALAEPITQSMISSKHSGGVAGASAGAIGGFKHINNLVQVPKVFPGSATHAQADGVVESISEAPQGGQIVVVGGQKHYVPVTLSLNVAKGDNIEAGDALTDGIPNPAEIVRHKGIGEGRRYFVDAFRKALTASNTYGNRRNIELVARGLINHVRLTDEVGDYVAGDILPYSALEKDWQPRAGHDIGPPKSLVGRYLERPVLHYTVGTRIGKKMADQMQQFGVQRVLAHRDPPPFEPEMVRGMANVSADPDWMTRMLGSYQQRSMLSAVHRGATSDTAGTSFVPGMAEGKDFGLTGPTKGWEPELKPPTPPDPIDEPGSQPARRILW